MTSTHQMDTSRLRCCTEPRDRYVYVIHGDDGSPFYVGLGKRERMYDHVRESSLAPGRRDSTKAQYIRECLARGFVPTPTKVAEDLTLEEAKAYERLLIKLIGRRDLGTGPLLNLAPGGNAPGEASPALRARRSAFIKTPEQRAKLLDAHARRRGFKVSAEVKAKMSVAARLRQCPEYSAKISAAGRRRTHNPEARLKMSQAKSGTTASVEARANMSRAHKGKRTFSKITADVVAQIHAEYSPVRGMLSALGRRYGVSSSNIRRIILRETWTDVA